MSANHVVCYDCEAYGMTYGTKKCEKCGSTNVEYDMQEDYARECVDEATLELRTEILDLKEKLRSLTEWRAMNTAPKGTDILVLFFNSDNAIDVVTSNGALWWDGVVDWESDALVGWLPLPGSEVSE